MIHTLQSCFLYLTYIFTVYCSTHRTAAVTFIVKNIISKTE